MQEKQKKWILRIALYLIGIMVLALGITLNTKTNLGVSPIISMPYAVAQIFGYETGTAVFVAYLIFIVLQIVLLKGKFPPFQLLQVAASYLTSAFITIFDRIFPAPDQMGMRLLVLVLAIILTAWQEFSASAAERTWVSEKIFLISPPSSFPLRSASSMPAAR